MKPETINIFILTVGIILSFPAVAGSAKRVPLNETKLYTEMTTDCERIDLPSWSLPTKSVLVEREGVTLDSVELCNNKKYPIYSVRFKYDPQGMTKDYFIPLYLNIMKENNNLPLTFVVFSDNTIINLSSKGKNKISTHYEYFSK